MGWNAKLAYVRHSADFGFTSSKTCFQRNARPEPLFKYFSKRKATYRS